MDFMELAAERYSVRKYSDAPVEQEKIDLMLKAAQLAPTAVNYQPQRIYVLKSDEALRKVRSVCRSTYGAPLVFMVCSDERRTWKSQTERNYSTGEMDVSIVCTHMMLEAWELGLGSVWVRLFAVNDLRRVFNLPAHVVPRCLLPVGYAAPDADDLYMQAQLSEGRGLDKCVLYAFRCAVAYANDPHPNPDEYRWWFFCDEGKGLSV